MSLPKKNEKQKVRSIQSDNSQTVSTRIYQEVFVDEMYTVPDLRLNQGSLLSDKYNLWAKYKFVLSKFYYSPGHEGSCSDVAREFNDKASPPNALIMNFGRAVQKTIGNFSVM